MKKIIFVLLSLFIMTALVPLISYATSATTTFGSNAVVENVAETQAAQVDCLTLLEDSSCTVFGGGTNVTAKAGKNQDDISLEISGDPYSISHISTHIGYTYYLVSVNFIPNYDLATISLCSDTVSDVLMWLENGWYLDKWNNITFVYNSADGTVFCYINGTLAETTIAAATVTNKIGIVFCTNSSSKMMYLDDYLVQTYMSAPVVSSTAVAPVGNIVGGNLITEDNVKVSDLVVQNAKLVVYEDDTYRTKLTDEDVLFSNNMAVYVNDRNMYSYYNILNNNLKVWGETSLDAIYDYEKETITVSGQLKQVGNVQMILECDGTVVHAESICSDETGGVDFTLRLGEEFRYKKYLCTLSYMDYIKQIQIVNPEKMVIYNAYKQPIWNGTNISETSIKKGYLGKGNTDSSHVYTASDKISNVKFSYLGDHYRYIIAEFNFASHNLSELKNLQVATGGNVYSAEIPKRFLKFDEWNNIIVVIDTEKSQSTVYLNGELTTYGKNVSGQFLTSEDENKAEFRIRADGTAPITFAVDDFKMITLAELPERVINKDYKSLLGSHISQDGKVLYNSGSTAEIILSDSKYKVSGAVTAIYDATNGNAISTGELPASAKLSLRTDDSTIKTYDLVALNGIMTWNDGESTKNAFAFVDSGIMIAIRYQNGRFSELDFVHSTDGMVKATMNSKAVDGEEIVFVVWDNLNNMRPLYPSVVAQ